MKKGKTFKKIKNDLVYLAVRGAIGFFRILPRKAALRAGSFLGRLAPYVARKERRLAVEHLTLAFGGEKSPEEIRRIARESFRYMALNFVDTVRIQTMNPEEVRSVCIPHNLERLQAKREGGGALCLTSHTGCWEMLGSWLAASGIPLAAIAKRLYDPRLEEELYRSRTHSGFQVISRGHDTREVIRCLKAGRLLMTLIDQDTKVKGIFVDFFGRPAHTATSPAHLSLRYDAPIIPVFTCRDENDRHHMYVGEAIGIDRTGDRDRDIAELTARCSRAIEDFIRAHPEQWVWFHRRWKTKPE
ncbi:MAG: lysophospholipid acyltransferase family protein [Candidatus Latescibacterota bacterium]